MYLFAPWYFSERLKNGACLLPFISTNLFWSWFNILMELFVLYRVPFFHCWKLVVIFTSGIQNCYTILFKKKLKMKFRVNSYWVIQSFFLWSLPMTLKIQKDNYVVSSWYSKYKKLRCIKLESCFFIYILYIQFRVNRVIHSFCFLEVCPTYSVTLKRQETL